MIRIIVATDENLLIGKEDSSNGMPWNIPEDLQHFKDTTIGKTILMGLTTYKAIGRPLPGRKTIVVSLEPFEDERVEVRDSLEEVIQEYKERNEDLFISGGASIYRQSLPLVEELLISRVPGTYTGETYFPDFSEYGFVLKETKPFHSFALEVYTKE